MYYGSVFGYMFLFCTAPICLFYLKPMGNGLGFMQSYHRSLAPALLLSVIRCFGPNYYLLRKTLNLKFQTEAVFYAVLLVKFGTFDLRGNAESLGLGLQAFPWTIMLCL